jgi:NADH dehydrogenase
VPDDLRAHQSRDRHDGRHHVVVVGAGFGGLAVVRGLHRTPVRVTLVDANNYHTFQPLLYQVATAGLDADDVAHPVRGIFPRRARRPVEVVMGEVDEIDTGDRWIELTDGRRIGYDTLVIAAGAVSNDFGIDGVEEHAFPLKTLDDAIALRTHLLRTFELAAAGDEIVPGALDVVVSGGGPTGVEMAGGIAELYAKVLAEDFPDLPVEQARIVIVEPRDRLLPPFHPDSSERAGTTLRRLGVEVRTGVGIDRVDVDGVHLSDGEHVPAATVVWAAGVRANPLAARLGVEPAGGGRIPVDDDLSVTGLDGVFALGDIAAARGPEGDPLPQVAQPAIQGGAHVARQILRRLDGKDTEPFDYTDKGSMATIGRHDAVTELANGWRFGGFPGWVAWLGLHLVYLMGMRNRLNVFVNWCWNYLTYDRASRLLSSTDLDRPAASAGRSRGSDEGDTLTQE